MGQNYRVHPSAKLAGAILVVAAVGAAAVLVTCAAPSVGLLGAGEPRESEEAEARAARCGTQLRAPEPALAEAAEAPTPSSRLRLEATVDTGWLAGVIDARVPTTLASAHRQPIGDPGEVTYTVTRGGLSFALAEDRLVVGTPIVASVSVCKPFGPLCPTYGSCQPKLSAAASVPLTLGSDYRLGKSQASYQINEGCSILGQDATGEIRSIADARIAAVRRLLDESVPDTAQAARQIVATLSKPLPLASGSCGRVHVDKLAQGRPALANGKLSLVALAEGRVELTSECGDREAALPPLEVGDGLPTEGTLAASLTLPWAELSAALARSLEGATAADSRITGARARAGRLGDQPTALLGVTLDGAVCGEAWLTAAFAYDRARNVVTLSAVKPFPGLAQADLTAVAALVEQRGSAPAPAALTALVATLDDIEERVGALDLDGVPDDVALQVSAAFAPAVVQLTPARSGLALVASRSGVVRVGVQAQGL
jgi:hypothetical protein